METIKICAGITQSDEIYFLEIEQKENKDFSMSGFTVSPMTIEDAETRCRERLEDGELWLMAVEARTTTSGLKDWIEEVLTTDGKLAGFDNSLLTDEIEVDGVDYIFSSESCGQHEEENLKHYFILKETFSHLNDLWKKYHLKKANVKIPEISQDIDGLLKKAIRIICLNEKL